MTGPGWKEEEEEEEEEATAEAIEKGGQESSGDEKSELRWQKKIQILWS